MTNLDSILKSRDITLPTKIHLVKAMVFPVAMYGCGLQLTKINEKKNKANGFITLKKKKEKERKLCRRIDAF